MAGLGIMTSLNAMSSHVFQSMAMSREGYSKNAPMYYIRYQICSNKGSGYGTEASASLLETSLPNICRCSAWLMAEVNHRNPKRYLEKICIAVRLLAGSKWPS